MGVTMPNFATNRARKRSKVLRLVTLNFVENFSPVPLELFLLWLLSHTKNAQQRRMMDDSMYPLDAVRPLARALRRTAISWHDADHRLVEKFAEDMTMQDFIDAAEDQRDRTLRENARMMAAFMNHDGAGKQMTLGEILDRDQVWRG